MPFEPGFRLTWAPLDWQFFVVLCGAAGTFLALHVWLGVGRFGQPFTKLAGQIDPQSVEIAGWERDRVMGVAKGFAATSVGFLTSIVTMVLKDEIGEEVSAWVVLGLVFGAVGVLLLGGMLAARARTFVEEQMGLS